MTLLVLAFLAFLFKYADRSLHWWLWFAVVISIITHFYELGTLELFAAIAAWKVLGDLFRR